MKNDNKKHDNGEDHIKAQKVTDYMKALAKVVEYYDVSNHETQYLHSLADPFATITPRVPQLEPTDTICFSDTESISFSV